MKRVLAWVMVLVLCLGLFAGCKKNNTEPTGGSNVVDTADLEAALEYIKTVYRKVSETTPKDYKRIGVVPVNGHQFEVVWTADVGEEYVKVVKEADGMVTIDVNEESKEEVPYVLTATISDGNGNEVSHSWNHILPATASAEDMLEIVKAAYALEPGATMGYDVTLTGEITMIKTPYDPSYKNITVVIVVAGAEDMPIECYRLKGEGCEDLRIGDTITVTGMLKNYNGTIEFDAGCSLDAVVKGEEVKAPEDPKQIVKEAYALGANQTLKYEATLTGTITEVTTPYNAQYGNVTVIMVIEGCESQPIQCYRLKGDGADKIGVNDVITVKGYITNYVGSKGYSTIQFTAGCQLLKWEDKAAPTQPSDPKVVVDQAYALGANETLKYEATLTGKVTKVNTAYDPSFGNVSVTIVVEGREDKPILCYRMKGTGADKIGIGDTITVKGYITNYVGDKGYSTIEYNYPTLISYTKNTNKAPTDSLEIIKAAYQLKAGEQLPYEATVTGTVTKVNSPYDPGYKNVTVTIVVAGAENMPLKCYRLVGDGVNKIGVGDVITVKGYIENYKHSSGDTEVEFVQGCQLVKWEDVGEDVPEPEAIKISIADAIAKGLTLESNKFTEEKYSVTGVITEVYQTTYGNMRITDEAGNILTIYGSYDKDGNRYDAMPTKPVAGDTVTLEGVLGQYNGTAQMKNGVVVAHTPGSGSTTPEDPTPEEPTPEEPAATITYVDAPVAGTAYKFVLNQAGLGKQLGFTGAMSGYYYGTTETIADMVDVYLEEVTGGYHIYFMDGETKTYLDIVQREGYTDKVNVVLTTSGNHTVYTLDTEYKFVKATVLDIEWYLGTYSTNTTISASKTSYIEDKTTIGVSQFVTWFATAEAGTTPDPEDPTPEEPTPEEPASLTLTEAVAMGQAKEHNTYTEEKYMVTGIITEVYQTTYGNMKITDHTGTILTIYGTYNADGSVRYDALETKPVAGDLITVVGIVGQYSGTAQIKNGWIVAHTPATSVADAIAIGAAKEHNTYTTEKHVVTGVITEVYQTTYGNMKIKDEAGNILTVYGTYNEDGTVRYDALTTKPVAGDTVTVYGILGQYNSVAQMKNGWILVHTVAPATPDPEPDPEPTPDPEPNPGTGDAVATFTFGTGTAGSHVDGNAYAGAAFENNGYTLTFTDYEKVYTGGHNELGTNFVKFGTSSVAGTLTFTVPENVAKVELQLAQYKTNTSKVSINGGEAIALTKGSATGEYDVIEIDTTTNKTVTVTTVSGGLRMVMYAVVYYEAETGNNGGNEGGEPVNPPATEQVNLATFTFGTGTTGTHVDGNDYKGDTFSSNGYSLVFTGYEKIYTGGNNEQNMGFVKFGTSSVVGTLTFEVPANVDKVELHLAGYKAKTSKITVNGGEVQTLTTSSTTGEYDVIVIDTSVNKTITVATASGATRAVMYSVVYYGYES